MGYLCGKATGNGLSGPKSWVGRGLRQSPGWGKQVDGVSDMVPTCLLCGTGDAQQRNNGPCQHFCLGESCPFSPLPVVRQFSSSPSVSRAFQAAAPALELGGSDTPPRKSRAGALKRNCLGLQKPSVSAKVPAGFHSQSHRDSSFQH